MNGFEQSLAIAVKRALNDWKLDQVVAMSFDTTSRSTGQENGEATFLRSS